MDILQDTGTHYAVEYTSSIKIKYRRSHGVNRQGINSHGGIYSLPSW